MLDPAIGALLAGVFALLFAAAAVHKLRAPAHFAEIFAAYRMLPPGAARMAMVVPLLEGLVAAALLVRAARAPAAAAGAALLLMYAAAIAVNLRRGRLDLACGCGGPDERRPIAPWMVVRNLLLALALAVLLRPWLARPWSAADALTVVGGIAVAALIYLSLDRLLSRVVPQGARLMGAA
ncbi:MAG TPA: MauE/DoxX family redox-associated membrane protein [Steroidobacteraceae bacterium]